MFLPSSRASRSSLLLLHQVQSPPLHSLLPLILQSFFFNTPCISFWNAHIFIYDYFYLAFNSVKFSTLLQTYIKHLLCSKHKHAFAAPTPHWVIQPIAHRVSLLVAFCACTSLLPAQITHSLRTKTTCLLLLCAPNGAYYWAQTLRPPLQPHSPFPCSVICTLMVMQFYLTSLFWRSEIFCSSRLSVGGGSD